MQNDYKRYDCLSISIRRDVDRIHNVATMAGVGAFVVVVRGRKCRDDLTSAVVWAVVVALWVCAVTYGERRMVRGPITLQNSRSFSSVLQ